MYILSCDGGGIRGIIPVSIIAELEKQLGGSISDYFDVMAGTSTGGILTLGLNLKDEDGNAKYTAEELKNLYRTRGKDIFYKQWFRDVYTGYGMWGAKYSSKGLAKVLKEYMGDATMQDLKTNTLITAYDLKADRPAYFRSSYAKKDPKRFDMPLKIVGHATGAAPTFFSPLKISNAAQDEFVLVDGGIVRNNPALAALGYAKELYPDAEEYHLVSIGTGRVHTPGTPGQTGLSQWASTLVEYMMDGSAQATDLELRGAFNAFKQSDAHKNSSYLRLQVVLNDDESDMTNYSKKNLKRLEKRADQIIHENEKELADLVYKLKQSKKL